MRCRHQWTHARRRGRRALDALSPSVGRSHDARDRHARSGRGSRSRWSAAQVAAILSGAAAESVGATWAQAERVVVTTEPRIDAALSSEIRSRYRDAANDYAPR